MGTEANPNKRIEFMKSRNVESIRLRRNLSFFQKIKSLWRSFKDIFISDTKFFTTKNCTSEEIALMKEEEKEDIKFFGICDEAIMPRYYDPAEEALGHESPRQELQKMYYDKMVNDGWTKSDVVEHFKKHYEDPFITDFGDEWLNWNMKDGKI